MELSGVQVADIVIVVTLLVAFYAGWRQGLISSLLSTVGVLAGLTCAAGLAPFLLRQSDETGVKLLLLIAAVILLVGTGNLVGGALGYTIRERIKWKKTLRLDSFIGALFQTMATLLVVWLIAFPLASNSSGPIAKATRSSTILGYVDRHSPDFLRGVPSQIAAMLSDSGLPPMVSPFEKEPVWVQAPAIKVEDVELVERLRPSVIHVIGESEQCARRLMGSGFVLDDRHVITNAHVVAGTERVSLDTVAGVFDATVVYYNPELDIAVLDAPGIELPPLHWAEQKAASGADAIVMGFPESGPFEAAPARIADIITVQGPNIYASGRVERESYTVRGSIRQGNSGGPMVNLEGEVLGVVFGAALDDSDIGYALTADEVRNAIGDVAALGEPVDTQACVLS